MKPAGPSSWNGLEHAVWRILREQGLADSTRFTLAVSGGLDSMVLLEIFLWLRPEADVQVAYFHHGPSDDPALGRYRDQAREAVTARVAKQVAGGYRFVTASSEMPLTSEEQMRDARWSFLRGIRRGDEPLVTAHHLDDRLETLLLKMMRGTSAEGAAAFTVWNGEILRPLLDETKVGLKTYAQERRVSFAEDPTNGDAAYLRNWIRGTWLPDLERRLPGGTRNLARSLFKMTPEERPPEIGEVLDRAWFMTLAEPEQLRVLARFLKRHRIHSFTSGQLGEIRKRLDKNQKELTFELLGRKWVINASQIMLQ